MSKGSQLTRDVAIVGDIVTPLAGHIQKASVLAPTYQNKASALVGDTLPAGFTLFGIAVKVLTASNAGDTGILNVGFVGGSGTELVNGQDVKSATGSFSELGNTTLVGTTLTSAKQLQAQYAETGSAATAGSFLVLIEGYSQ